MLFTITERCNLSCSHCLGRYGPKGQDMSFEDFKFALNQTAMFDNVLLVSGGEPLLNPDFEKMILFALRKPKLIIEIITNGTLLKKYKNFLKYHIDNQHVFVQVTNDPRYYNKETDEQTVKDLNLEIERNLVSLDSLGRAKDNKLTPYGRNFPMCSNLILGAAQTKSFEDLVQSLEMAGKFCLFTVEPNLDLMLSECHQIKLANLKDSDWKEKAYNKLLKENQKANDNIFCKNCGLDNRQIFNILN